MEKQSYSYGKKLAALIIHQTFMIMFVISIFLLVMMINKNILELTDIGTENFLDSGYYTRCMEEKCDDLRDYLHLMQRGNDRGAEAEIRYLQYTNEFGKEDKNFCFWYQIDGVWYTNQPDTVTGQSFDVSRVLVEAKSMGNYLIYDMINKEFSTDIKGLEKSFFTVNSTQMAWPMSNVVLVLGVDTQLSAKDDLYDAQQEYNRLHPWIKVCVMGALIGLVGWVLTLVYLTLCAGHRDEDDDIHLNAVDRIKTEILVAVFLLFIAGMTGLLGSIGNQYWEASGIMVAAGTVSAIIDTGFLIFYLSMVRRMKADTLWTGSLACWLLMGFQKLFYERKVTTRVLVVFLFHLLLCFVLVVGAFGKNSIICLVLLILLSGVECYYLLRKEVEHYQILCGVEEIRKGDLGVKIDTESLHGENQKLADEINNIGSGLLQAVDENTKNERMKADLITNVSHDIKTPLTSIINYVSLIKMEEIQNEKVMGYVRILDEKSQRLKQLTEDLVEASRISSGNVKLDMAKIDLVELVYQTGGEFNEKFEAKELTIVTKIPQEGIYIYADGRQLYRVIENLYNNVAKYALEKTRVYVEITLEENKALFSIKNVSEKSLAKENANSGDLTERFARGDVSRTTEGSGLGLSIAKNLTLLMGGKFIIQVDGDLFKAILEFPEYEEEKNLDF